MDRKEIYSERKKLEEESAKCRSCVYYDILSDPKNGPCEACKHKPGQRKGIVYDNYMEEDD